MHNLSIKIISHFWSSRFSSTVRISDKTFSSTNRFRTWAIHVFVLINMGQCILCYHTGSWIINEFGQQTMRSNLIKQISAVHHTETELSWLTWIKSSPDTNCLRTRFPRNISWNHCSVFLLVLDEFLLTQVWEKNSNLKNLTKSITLSLYDELLTCGIGLLTKMSCRKFWPWKKTDLTKNG
jgi:hypothetical protein